MSDGRIKNGNGEKRYAGVDAEFRVEAHATTITEGEFINEHDQESYVVYADVTPTAGGDVFFLMENTHTDKLMVLDWYRAWTEDSAEAIDVLTGGSGTLSGTTELTPVNSYVNSSNTAQGNFYEGVDITGLTGPKVYDRLRISGDGKDVVDTFPGKIIVPKSGIVYLRALNGAIPIETTVAFHYINKVS